MSDMLECHDTDAGCVFAVKAEPRARKNAIEGLHDRALRVKVTTAPEGGKANASVCELIAKAIKMPKGALSVIAGEGSRRKKVLVKGLNCAKLLGLLRPHL